MNCQDVCIGSATMSFGIGNYGFVLFDNTPGGAGYVRRMRDISILIGMLEAGARCKWVHMWR